MRIFGYELSARRISGGMRPPTGSSGGWFPIVRESYPGAWQQNVEVTSSDVLNYWAVFACTTLISADIGKIPPRLVEQNADGIWQETESAAFSPVLRKPNRYQTITKFVEQWVSSKLIHGNTYVLKERDQRGVVTALYVLDPTRVLPLVTPEGEVYYQIGPYNLAGLGQITLTSNPVVPASEIIHDLMVPLYHPLVGVSPIYACGTAALQGLNIQNNSTQFFANYSAPGGILTAPGAINPDEADRLKTVWETKYAGQNLGKLLVTSYGMKYEPLTINAVDAQLIEQLKWTAEPICGCFHVPTFLIDSTKTPPYANSEIALQQYYSQCLQSHFVNVEAALEDGLALPDRYGVEFDVDDLIWMDTATRTKAAHDAIAAGVLAPDEARAKYFGLGPVEGGDTPYLQQQMFSLAALAERDQAQPFAKPEPAVPALPAAPTEPPTKAYRWELARRVAHKRRHAA